MNISNDRFIRTTDDYHVESVQKIFRRLYEQGDIYKGKYVGKYCTDCEAFWTETQVKDGKCPDCGREVKDAEEEAYFFRLSKYAGRVRDLLVNTDFLEPRSRVNEMVNNFIKPGLYRLTYSQDIFPFNNLEFSLGGDSTGLQGSIVQKYDYYGTRLEAGTYRVVLEMKAKDGTPHYLAAEFDVE